MAAEVPDQIIKGGMGTIFQSIRAGSVLSFPPLLSLAMLSWECWPSGFAPLEQQNWKWNECGNLLSLRAASCTCALQRLWECVQGNRERSTEREGQHVSEGAVLWRDQGKVLCYTPKQTSATNLEDRGKQIYFHFWIPITTLILRNIYIRKTKT